MANNFIKKATEHLKIHKFRITKPRLFVIELLSKASIPLSAQKIHEELKLMQKSLDLVSVYRILEMLHEQGLVHRDTETNNYFSCLHCDTCPDNTHIFLKCEDCKQVREVDYHGEIFSNSFKRKLSKLKARPTREMIYLSDLCINCT